MSDYKNAKPKTKKTELHMTIYSNMTTSEKVYRLYPLTVHHKKRSCFAQFLIRILTAYKWFSVCRTDSFDCPSYSVLWG